MTAASLGETVAYGPLLVAIPVALLAGIVSFASPCCLPLVPGYLAYVTGASGAEAAGTAAAPSRRLAVTGTTLFVLGFSLVFVSYGTLFGALGATLVEYQETILRVLGVVTICLGLMFSGLLGLVPLVSRTYRPAYRPQAGLVGAPILGVMFGVGWTPCIGPTLAAVLSLATTSGTAGRGALLSLVYSLGLGVPFVLAAAGLSRVFAFSFARRHALAVMRGGGLLLVVLGVLQVTGIWGVWLTHLRTVVGTWQSPI